MSGFTNPFFRDTKLHFSVVSSDSSELFVLSFILPKLLVLSLTLHLITFTKVLYMPGTSQRLVKIALPLVFYLLLIKDYQRVSRTLLLEFFLRFTNWPQERPKKKTGHSRLVGGTHNKQGNLFPRLVLGEHKTSNSQHLPARILKIYIAALTGSVTYHPDGLTNTLLSQGYILENSSHCSNSGQNVHSKDGERGGASNCPCSARR